MTPLILAASLGYYEVVEFLLDEGAKINGRDKIRRNALSLAARNSHAKIVSLLL